MPGNDENNSNNGNARMIYPNQYDFNSITNKLKEINNNVLPFDPSENIFNNYLLPIFTASAENNNNIIMDPSGEVTNMITNPIPVSLNGGDVSFNINVISQSTKEQIENNSKYNINESTKNSINAMDSMLNSKKRVMMNDNAER